MKSTITIVLLCLIFSPTLLAGNNELTPAQIEQQVANRRREIENYYQGQILEVTLRAQKKLSQLEIDDSLIYKSLESHTIAAELVSGIATGRYELWPEPDRRFNNWNLHRIHYGAGYAAGSRTTTIEDSLITEWTSNLSGASLVANRSYMDKYRNEVVGNFTKRFVNAKRKINEMKTDIIARRDTDILLLETQRRYALTVGLDEYRKYLESPPIAVERKDPKNVVTAILYSDDKPAAVLNGKIVHVGDELDDDIKITEINKDSVEFQKDDNTWCQAVGEKPKKYW